MTPSQMFRRGFEYTLRAIELTFPPEPQWATNNVIALDLPTMRLRDFTTVQANAIPVLIDAPYAGHRSTIADYADGQSLVQTYLANGATQVYVTDWKSATPKMKDYQIDEYLSDLLLAIDSLGGRVHLVGLCQGGWLSSMVAALHPEKVASLVLAGSPIDTDAGGGRIKKLAHKTPMSTYKALVTLGCGVMRGKFMIQGWKSQHPEQHYIRKYTDLFDSISNQDSKNLESKLKFASWYETPVDLPGKFYLQVIDQLFKRNLLFKGEFVGLGRPVLLGNIACPVFLLAGAKDDITTPEQVYRAREVLTGAVSVTEASASGGHISLFMGKKSLRDIWPPIVRWTRESCNAAIPRSLPKGFNT